MCIRDRCVCVCVCVCCACVHACVRACVCVGVCRCLCVRACVRACICDEQTIRQLDSAVATVYLLLALAGKGRFINVSYYMCRSYHGDTTEPTPAHPPHPLPRLPRLPPPHTHTDNYSHSSIVSVIFFLSFRSCAVSGSPDPALRVSSEPVVRVRDR